IEPCEARPFKNYDKDDLPWAVRGAAPGQPNKVVTDKTYFEDIDQWNERYIKKMRRIMDEEQRWESIEVEDADIVFVAYGISSRVAEGAVREGRRQGLKLGLIRPITLWPYPRKAFSAIPTDCKAVVTVEMNMMGQMREDVIIATHGQFHTYTLALAQRVATVNQVIGYAKAVMDGKIKEEEVF
ncbi:MAG: transketolase C-terminal domain-containing protein, partial [Clostridia bacterium]